MNGIVFQVAYPDGATGVVLNDHRFDLCLPSGSHVRGIGTDLESAKGAMEIQHNIFILRQWAKGAMGASGQYVCPLT